MTSQGMRRPRANRRILSCTSSNGYSKIGYSGNIEQRLSEWKRKCHYEPIKTFKGERIPNGKVVERLVQTELENYRRIEIACSGGGSNCSANHKEWFEINYQLAFEAVTRWTRWMQKKEPYEVAEDRESELILRKSWTNYIASNNGQVCELRGGKQWQDWIDGFDQFQVESAIANAKEEVMNGLLNPPPPKNLPSSTEYTKGKLETEVRAEGPSVFLLFLCLLVLYCTHLCVR